MMAWIYLGKVTKGILGILAYSAFCFLPGTGNALTTTNAGSAIIWEEIKQV